MTPLRQRERSYGWKVILLAAVAALAVAGTAVALDPKEQTTSLDAKEFFNPELALSTAHERVEAVLGNLPNKDAWENFQRSRALIGEGTLDAFVDPRSGVLSNLVGPFPLLPGRGAGNNLTLDDLGGKLGRAVAAVDPGTVAEAVVGFAVQHQDLLAVALTQLGGARTTQIHPDLWQVSFQQTLDGIPVRHARLVATISHGNLLVVGAEAWGNVKGLNTKPKLSADEALAAGYAYAGGASAIDEMLRPPTLEIHPLAPREHQLGERFAGPIGAGYRHRLVWSYVFRRPPDEAAYEVLVDAHDGEVLAFQDTNQYVNQSITGGVYPVTSTGICPTNGTCGTMQSGWPMPFADTGLASPNNFTNSAGIFNYTSGTTTTTLTGRFVDIVDSCGAVSNSSTTGAINLGGTNNQHDCTTGGGSAGNTPASRTAFYEVNKLAEQARGWLPNNTWLQSRLTTNVNLNNTCNAFWNGSSINFYRSGGGCRNTGELAGVFDHEWGHGLDDNDAGGGLSNSSEAYADIAAIYRLQTSCVGHGFFQTVNDGCGMTADGTGFNADEAQQGAAHCDLDCSGVRDADYLKHNPNTPDTALGFVCSSCLTGPGPCGRQVHCAAAPSRQAAWDLVARDLQGAPFNLDSQTAFIVGNKLFFQGSGNIGSWHACTCGSSSSGCGSTNAYMQWLTADDDNGNLNDGTPHMTAIFNAFNRHGIACATPTPQNSGCAAGPTAATTLSGSPGNYSAALSWNSIAGATRYWVFRSEGHAGCNFGKALIAETTGTSFTDTQVAAGRIYSYNVVAAGSSSACYGRASNCVQVVPTADTPTPDFSVSCSPSSLTVTQGGSTTSTCTVTSTGGFSSAVSLSCANLPSGSSCSFSPASVTPPSNGSANSTLTVSATATAATGSFSFQARGTSGATVRNANMTLQVNAQATPNFSVACNPTSLSIQQGASGTSTCTVSSTNGFASAVDLSCTGLPAGASCGFVPDPVTPPANGSANSALTLSVSGSTSTGTFPFQVQGVSGALTRTFAMTLQVTAPPGGGVVFFDNFESALGWTTNPNGTDTAISGQWERGDPEPTDSSGPKQLGTTVSGVNDLVTGRLAGASAGVNDIDGGTTSIRSPFITLPSGTNLTLSFSYYLAHGTNSSTADFLRVSIVGSTTSQVFQELGGTEDDDAVWATASVNISAFAGQTVRIHIEAADASTASLVEAAVDDVRIAEETAPTVVFSDDFETSLGWTTNPNGTDNATTGLWERGDPEATNSGGAKQLGTTVSGVNDLVTGRLAGAGAGDFDIDGGTTSVQSPPIALPSSGTLTLSFSYYLAHGTNSSTADFLRVSVVGATTSQVFQELGGTENDNGVWAAGSANISAFAGQTVRILIQAADAATASLVEAAVDDVRITQQ